MTPIFWKFEVILLAKVWFIRKKFLTLFYDDVIYHGKNIIFVWNVLKNGRLRKAITSPKINIFWCAFIVDSGFQSRFRSVSKKRSKCWRVSSFNTGRTKYYLERVKTNIDTQFNLEVYYSQGNSTVMCKQMLQNSVSCLCLLDDFKPGIAVLDKKYIHNNAIPNWMDNSFLRASLSRCCLYENG